MLKVQNFGTIVYSIDDVTYTTDLIASHSVKSFNFFIIIIRAILIFLILYFLKKMLIDKNNINNKKNNNNDIFYKKIFDFKKLKKNYKTKYLYKKII